MNQYPLLMQYLPFGKRKIVSNRIILAVVSSRRPIDQLHIANQLIQFILPVIQDTDAPDEDILSEYEFQIEQQNLARLLHLVAGEPT